MQNNKPFNLTRTNMTIAWLSIFVESWLLLLRKLPVDNISVFFFCFFILVAVGSWIGTGIEERQDKPNVKIISKEKSK